MQEQTTQSDVTNETTTPNGMTEQSNGMTEEMTQSNGMTQSQPASLDQFLEHINANQKQYGHNKFQLQIEDLNRENSHLMSINSEKDSQIDLYKKSVANLQSELQVKMNQLTCLEEELATQRKLQETGDKTEVITEQLAKITLIQQEKQSLADKLQDKDSVINELTNKLSLTNLKITELETSNRTLSTKNDGLVKDIEQKNTTILDLQNALSLKNDTNTKLSNELEFVKLELANTKLELNVQQMNIKTLSQQLDENENLLHEQLKPTQETISITNSNNSIQGRDRRQRYKMRR